MRILITTQMVDRDDPILGFFHGWIIEFAKHFEHVHVICLKEGVHTLPKNVSVYSLGKEHGVSYRKYLSRFIRYVWQLRGDHDIVFSHMNPHYIVLAGWFWSVCKKPMFFWRNHAQMNIKTKIAAYFARRVFYTSSYACTRIFTHAVQMPVGIDMSLFKEDHARQRSDRSVLFLGRISPVKRIEIFIDAGSRLSGFDMHVYGGASKGQEQYRQEIETRSRGVVTFHEGIPNYETPAVYSQFDMYVNLTPEGSMDKTVLEAAACGVLVIVANKSFAHILPDMCLLKENTPESLADHIQKFGQMSPAEKETYRIEVRQNIERGHSLTKLATELMVYFQYE